MSNRQQPDQRADNNRRPPMGFQITGKILYPGSGVSLSLNKDGHKFSENRCHT